jgi:hypothetical protein
MNEDDSDKIEILEMVERPKPPAKENDYGLYYKEKSREEDELSRIGKERDANQKRLIPAKKVRKQGLENSDKMFEDGKAEYDRTHPNAQIGNKKKSTGILLNHKRSRDNALENTYKALEADVAAIDEDLAKDEKEVMKRLSDLAKEFEKRHKEEDVRRRNRKQLIDEALEKESEEKKEELMKLREELEKEIYELDTSKLKEFAFTDNNDEENIHPEDQQAVPKRLERVSDEEMEAINQPIEHTLTQDEQANNEFAAVHNKNHDHTGDNWDEKIKDNVSS